MATQTETIAQPATTFTTSYVASQAYTSVQLPSSTAITTSTVITVEMVLPTSTSTFNGQPNSGDGNIRANNTTIGIVAGVVCVIMMLTLFLVFRYRRSKICREPARNTTGVEVATEDMISKMPTMPPTSFAGRRRNSGGSIGRAFYGDQIFRHELCDGSEIEKGGTGRIVDRGGIGCADGGNRDPAELEDLRERWNLPMAELKRALKERRHKLG